MHEPSGPPASGHPPDAQQTQPSPANHLPLRLMLAFRPASYERQFVAHYVAFYHRYAQASLVLGLLLVLGDFAVDLVANPGVGSNHLRLTMAVPILAAGLGYTLLPTARQHWQPLIACFIVAVGACLFGILLKMDSEGGPGLRSWVGILNFTFLEFYCFVILGVQFRFALIAGGLILLAFEAALWWHPDQVTREVLYWSYHVVTLFILAAGIGWWREYALRKEFLMRTELDEARAAAVRLAQTKSDFLATVSHEIRTPMNGVLGMTELLLNSELLAQQRAWAETVQASGRHLLALINNVLDVSKIESGRLRLEAVDFDLGEVIDEALAMFAQPAQAKGLTLLGPQTPPGAVLALRGDPLRLRQVVANLVGNAIKFTERGQVEVHLESRGAGDGMAHVRISVADTGIGIPPEVHAHIFEQFSQADSATTRRHGGTGLGLAICRQLTDLMGGRIGVESQLGQGARFTVELDLPLAERRAVAAPLAGAPQLVHEGLPHAAAQARTAPPQTGVLLQGSVLLVDDHPINQSVAVAMLRRLGLQCEVADNGAIAVEKVAAGAFDLVLMDCQMPVMDGYQATEAIRRLPGGRGASLPIVALTANTQSEDEARCLASGMDAILAKPFTNAALGALLARWLPEQAGR